MYMSKRIFHCFRICESYAVNQGKLLLTAAPAVRRLSAGNSFEYSGCNLAQTKIGTILRNQHKCREQLRKYSPLAGNPKVSECWNCKSTNYADNQMMCGDCGHLRDVDSDSNYFDLLNLPKTFNLEQQELSERFRKLQTVVHPDKFSNKTSREQSNSADWSSLINRAYKTLLTPIERGQYMLKMHGESMPQGNSSMNQEFLSEMMERNEQIEEATTKEQLDPLYEQITQEFNEKSEQLSEKFEKNDLMKAKSILVEMKYLINMQNTIRNKLHQLLLDSMDLN